MAAPTKDEDTCSQMSKAKDNVEANPTLYQGNDASCEQGIEA